MNYTEDQFDRLPKWAKTYINTLEMRNRELQDDINGLFENPDSNTRYDVTYQTQYNLPDGANILFRLESGDVYARIDKRGFLGLYANNGDLAILPRSANTANVIILPR